MQFIPAIATGLGAGLEYGGNQSAAPAEPTRSALPLPKAPLAVMGRSLTKNQADRLLVSPLALVSTQRYLRPLCAAISLSTMSKNFALSSGDSVCTNAASMISIGASTARPSGARVRMRTVLASPRISRFTAITQWSKCRRQHRHRT